MADVHLILFDLTAIVVLVFAIYFPRHRRREMVSLDRAFIDESPLSAHLTDLLGGTVARVTIRKIDLVRDTTVVDVRYRVSSRRHSPDERSVVE